MTVKLSRGVLSGNAIKIIAAVFMTIDHIGFIFYSYGLMSTSVYWVMRALGRIALPLFAFMIAEGCRYTKNKLRYFLTTFSIGVICTAVYYVTMGGAIYLSIMTTFSLSILLIFAYQAAVDGLRAKNGGKFFCFAAAALAIIGGSYVLDKLADTTGGTLDYGVIGVIMPLSAYIIRHKWLRLIPFAICLAASFLSDIYSTYPMTIQWVGMAAILILALYNGERGKYKMKYFFYLFYPIHLALLEGLAMLISMLM